MAVMVSAAWIGALGAATSQPTNTRAEEVLSSWYGLVLELVRHTPTYTPPVASRSLAYLGVTAFESVATGSAELQSLAGQLNGLKAVPQREADKIYDEAVVVQAAMAFSARNFFDNTGPTGHHAMAALEAKLHAKVLDGVATDVVARSEAYGKAVAEHVLAWSKDDGGAVIENMGFPMQYELTKGPGHWVPTNLIAQQQKPLLPNWGKNRTFAMPSTAVCGLPPPLEYSEDKTSEFYKQALEVVETKQNLTPEQRAIAKFWSDDAMLTPTPPGHWISIALQIFKRDNVELDRSVDVLARLGVAQADAFIGCWNGKFQYDLLRPITYIRRTMDPKWEPLLNTPPFPEYPSGHSTQSGAAATVMTQIFGDNFAFEDVTRRSDGVKPRAFPNFWAAANEAGISRLYGGIHYRAAIERGLEQGRCIGAFTNALRTRK
jgi:PAP2 superfamily